MKNLTIPNSVDIEFVRWMLKHVIQRLEDEVTFDRYGKYDTETYSMDAHTYDIVLGMVRDIEEELRRK